MSLRLLRTSVKILVFPYCNCLKVILDVLEKLSKPDVNALLREFGFQLLYELHADPLTICPAMDLLSTRNRFFLMHQGDTFVVAPLS
ncbi:hypothetical protein ACH5RR_024844 [Cinchona calisaya]|uniref:Uncharacterized protein n=1 Tax=Cinchona calisaya TaxID=153742 RepID=A0ABD2YXY8_9GENT